MNSKWIGRLSVPHDPWMYNWKSHVESFLTTSVNHRSLLFCLGMRTHYAGFKRAMTYPSHEEYLMGHRTIFQDLASLMNIDLLSSSESEEGKKIEAERLDVKASGIGWKNHVAHQNGELDAHVLPYGFKPWNPSSLQDLQELEKEIKFLDNRYNQLKESKFHDLLLEADQGETNYMMAYTGDLHRARQWGWWVNVNKDKVKEDTGGVSLSLSHSTDGNKPEVGLVRFDWHNATYSRK